ncbi:MAG TPA: DinB family protein [Ignavibacteriaceae bacterium]
MNSMVEHFIHLFKYSSWATERAAESITSAHKITPDAIKLLSHILSSQYVWLSRITGEKNEMAVWDNFTIEECFKLSVEVTSKWINLLEGKNNEFLEKRFKYKNSKGDDFDNSLKDIVTHIINHSTYHRAQIAQIVKRSEGIPAITDYIVYQRELQR